MAPRRGAWGAYKAIAAAIRARIADGEYPVGARLTSEAQWCAEYGVARNTLRRALAQLASEGLIIVEPGAGRTVAVGPPGRRPQSLTPQYRRIAVQLRADIAAQRLRPGDPLPSEAALAQRYGVSRGTARHALAELEGAGLVVAMHGKGRFVRRP